MLNPKFKNMTEKEIKEAKYIKDNILPKLQEIQRDLYADPFISMDIDGSNSRGSMSVYIRVRESVEPFADIVCSKNFDFTTFITSKEQRFLNDKALRGVYNFVKNWQERLA